MYGPPPNQPTQPMPGPPTPRPPGARAWLIVAGAAVALVVLAALFAATNQDDKAPAAATKATTSPTPTPSRTLETWEHIPTDRQEGFVAYLHQLDPGLTPTSQGARPRPLRRAVSVCWDIYDRKPAKEVLHNTAYRYNGGQASVPDGSPKAQKILAAVKKWICSAPELRKVYDSRHP